MSSFSSLIYLMFLVIHSSQAIPIYNIANETQVATTGTSESIIESLLTTQRKNKYTSVVLTSNIDKQLNSGDSIQIECPLPRSTHSNKLNQDIKSNKQKTAPIFITTWFKDQVKVHQFIGEYLERVTFNGRRLKITDLNKADMGIYSCEIVMGTGQIVHSSNLTLQIDEFESNNRETETSISNQAIDENPSENDEEEIIDYDQNGDRSVYSNINEKKNSLAFINFDKDLTNSQANVHYSIYNVPGLKAQSTSQLNFKSEKNNQMLSTPVVVIIAVASVSTVLILFLYCFYKNI